jgi:hypothetical protein
MNAETSNSAASPAPANVLLSRLSNVRRSGKGWRADCPVGHSSPGSLSISEGEDGTVLFNCFACNDKQALLAHVDLSFADLYPRRLRDNTPEGRQQARARFRQAGWGAALGVIGREAVVVMFAAQHIPADAISPHDAQRLAMAIERIQCAWEVLCP